jgi:hypothetical protein
MNCLREVINPNRKLNKMICLSKLMFIFQIFLNILKFIYRIQQVNILDSIIDIFSILFLFMMISTFFYIFAALYLISTFFSILYLFFDISIFFQNYWANNINKMTKNALIIITICFSYSIFSMNVIFHIFKELKAQYLESIGIRFREIGNNNNNNNININNNIINNEINALNNDIENLGEN